jgi:2-keto-4-pentenoate hydratase/2-oxohepta-3-ene-1,7-dioic acid hydratase in catechol pathway
VKLVRYVAEGRVSYGAVERNTVKQIAGSPYGKVKFSGREHPLSRVKLVAPCRPHKIFAMALNYKSHVHDAKVPTEPQPFFKVPTCIVGPGDTIILPKKAARVEEEAELVVVIGRRCSKVSESAALDYVLGYTCGNDVSARDWQRGDTQWWRAKSSDSFGPIGPHIVTDLDASKLRMWARVNGKVVQECHTSELLFGVPTLISFISQFVTLEPGDLIFTGTSGTPVPISDGDVVEVEVEKIGVLSNPVKAEK